MKPLNPLGRLAPTDWEHVERYPLTATTLPTQPVPVVIGINWYEAFDRPVKGTDGVWRIAAGGNLGRVRGGHCVCLEPKTPRDTDAWYRTMDQGSEGSCVGFGATRCMMLLNRKRYDAPWLYREAQKVDEWPGEDYDGTSVRAGMDVLRTRGHRTIRGATEGAPDPAEGIAANRWAQDAREALEALGTSGLDYVVVLNSWGTGYPHRTRMPATILDRLIREDGEVSIPTDR